MEKGSCSRISKYDRRNEVDSGSVSLLNVSNRNLNEGLVGRVVAKAEVSCSTQKIYRFSCKNRPKKIESGEEDHNDDNDEEYMIYRRESISSRNRRNPNKTQRNHGRRKGISMVQNPRGLLIQETQKSSILSWLIDSGTVQLNGKVCYVDQTGKWAYGKITREGILCQCCQRILTVSEFAAHAGGSTDQPFQSIFIDKNITLLQCQMNAWSILREKCRHNRPIINYEDDSNDDTCGVCGDGGNLMCCDTCPSTFHSDCLGLKMVPTGEWYCSLCLCKYCGLVAFRSHSPLLTCRQCEDQYHRVCIQEEDESSTFDHNGSSFCGKSCRQLFEQLQNLVGIKISLEREITWSIIRCFDSDLDTYGNGFYQRMQYNSTLAATLAVMEECFDPIIDCRTGINMIQNIICNQGSNLRRLNFSGFYTVVLQRGDEIISAASIRIHGTRLAEMPFIGTRNKYRRQGMCKRLLNAIASTLRDIGVKKIIIPSVSDRVNKWINGYGFKHIEEPLKQKMRNMNLLTFPKTVQLQKVLLMKVNVATKKAVPAGNDAHLRTDRPLLVPRPFDLNQAAEEESVIRPTHLNQAAEEESVIRPTHLNQAAEEESVIRPTHGVFAVLNTQEGTIRYERVQVRQ